MKKISRKDIPEEVENAFNDAYYVNEMNIPEAMAYALNRWKGLATIQENDGNYTIILPLVRK